MDWLTQLYHLLKDINLLSSTIRIILAILCGGIIGLERGRANQAAGMRTYMLVCVGATIVMLTGHYMFMEFHTGDPARLGAQVISGIGFLGAGSIIISGKTKIRGLTTAAGLWVSACIGLSIGIGFYEAGILVTLAVFLIMSKLRKIEDHFTIGDEKIYLYLEMDYTVSIIDIQENFQKNGLFLDEVQENQFGKRYQKVNISVKSTKDYSSKEIVNILESMQGIKLVKCLY